MDIKLDLPVYIKPSDILEKISDYDIYKRYCSYFPSKSCLSPFRNEKNPSFAFFELGSRWFWKDYALGESADVFDFVMRMEGITSFNEVLHKINDNLALGLNMPFRFEKSTIPKSRKPYESNVKTVRSPIFVAPKKWEQYELDYFAQWDISKSICDFYHVKVADAAWLGEWVTLSRPFAKSSPTNPLFYFHFEKTQHVKIYQPYADNKKDKFRSNCDNLTDIQGYEQCQIKLYRNKPLVLTKALKECMFYRRFGINAMALHGEGSRIYPGFIRHLRKYCGPIISVYDDDPAGVLGAMHLSKNYMIPRMFTDGGKNVTDIWLYNKPLVFNFLNKLYDEFDRIQSSGVYSEYTRQLCIQSFAQAY